MALCKRIKRRNPTAEAPVNNKNFLGIPPTFSFTVKNISAAPSKKKTTIGDKNRREPLSKSLNTGMTNRHTITMKTPINAQNIDQLSFPFTFPYALRFPAFTLTLVVLPTTFLSFLIALPDLNRFRLTKPLVLFISYSTDPRDG